MSQNDDYIEQEGKNLSRFLNVVKLLHELGNGADYRLLSILREGSFGIIFLVEEHPIKWLVARKVVKPRMDTKQVNACFETERQALTMLYHPHFARVFDVGATRFLGMGLYLEASQSPITLL